MFFGFSKMAPERCVFWHHIYHCKFPQEEVHLWSKFHVNRTNSCREMFFSCWPDQALHLSNSDIIMKSLMTTSLTSYSTGGVLDNNEPCLIFSIKRFRRYKSAKSFGFSKMAPVPRDRWCHTYRSKLPQEELHLRSKFRVNWTNSCKEKRNFITHLIKRYTCQIMT